MLSNIKKCYDARWVLMAFALFLFSAVSLQAKSAPELKEIKGVVVDADLNEPLAGANVFVKGTNVGSASDLEGKFSFVYNASGEFTLVVSFIGYKKYEETYSLSADVSNLVVKLQEDIFQTEEVVVTGIANRRSKSVAEVAVSRLNVDQLTEKADYSSLNQLVNGKLAGVQIQPASGNVGGGFRFFVRSGGGLNGNEQPIIFVDGVRVDNSQLVGFFTGGQGVGTLSDINPDDIENIEFLKGSAAAASYGTNGSNGVVLITTKKGRISAGSRGGVSVNYKLTLGSNEQSFDYDPADFVTANDANNTFRSGDIQQHNINISGGNNFIKYYTSFEKRDEQGIQVGNYLNRHNLRANIDVFPSEKLTFTATAGFTASESDVPQNDNNIRGWLGNTLLFASSYAFTDSLSIANLRNNADTDRFIGSFQASFIPRKNLEVKASIGVDNSDLRWDEYLRSDLFYPNTVNGQRSVWTRSNRQITFDLNARYSYSLMDGRLQGTSIVGTQFFDRDVRTAFFQVQNFSSPLITDIGAGADLQDKGESKLNTRDAGIFTTHSFSFNDTYFMTVGLRNDFASSVGENAPDIFYPQASIAMRLDKFNFLPSTFGLFKLRAAYGETGILPALVDAIPYLWSAESGGYGAGAVLNAIGNRNIEPERVKELEFGFETELFGNYALEFTYYMQSARQSIIDFRNALSTGQTATAVPFNIGKVDGKGLEALLQATPFRSRNFQVDLTLTSSWQTNEVKDLGGAQPIFDGFDVNVTKEGLRNHEFYTFDVIGARFNEDGTYAGSEITDERISFGNPIPNYTGSFALNVNLFKNLNVYVMADWATGHSIFNLTKQFAARFGNVPELNRLEYQLGFTNTPPEGEEGLQQFSPGSAAYKDAANRYAQLDFNVDGAYIEEADFLKLREISVSYNLRNLVQKIQAANFVRNLTVGFSARNIWTTTKYSGADPEVNFDGARSLSRGQDFLTLQNPKVYAFFLQIGF